MANETRIRKLAIGGLITNASTLADGSLGLPSAGTTFKSAGLAAVAGGVSSTEHLPIVIDPDGLYGAPEPAYITALTAGSTSATVSRGQEGGTARDHPRDVPWVHAVTVRDLSAGRVGHKKRTAGNLTLNSTVWANASTTLDITLTAQAGDVVEYGVDYMWGQTSTGPDVGVDAATVVSTSVRNHFMSTAPGGYGNPGWASFKGSGSDALLPISGSAFYTLESTDVSTAGTVLLRLRYRTIDAKNATIRATTTQPMQVWAKNHGPQEAQ